MKDGTTIMAKPDENIAILQIDNRNNIHGFVTLGGISTKVGFTYPEISSDLIEKADRSEYPIRIYKYKNGKVILPLYRKYMFKIKRKIFGIKYWYKKGGISDFLEIFNNLMIPHLCVSLVSASVSSIVALSAVSVMMEDKQSYTLGNFLTFFFPCLTVFVAFIGIYITLRETRLGNERQRKASVKPNISLSNNKTPTGKPNHGRIIFLHADNSTQITRSELLVENVGLATARNIGFLYSNENQVLLSYGFSIKSLKPDSTIEIEVYLPDTFDKKKIMLYSICENIYGDMVFHAHHFYLGVNGENIYHQKDRQVADNTKEYNFLTKYLDI